MIDDIKLQRISKRIDDNKTAIVTLQNNIGGIAGNPIRCKIERAAAQVIAGDSQYYAIQFDTEVTDTDGMFDSAVSNTTAFIKTAGPYDIAGSIDMSTNTSDMYIAVSVNGTIIRRMNKKGGGVVSSWVEVLAKGISLQANDEIQLKVWQNSGGNLNLASARLDIVANQGAKGDTGAKGDKGDTGNTGAQGIQGIQGNAGTNGTDGADGVSLVMNGEYAAGTTYHNNTTHIDIVSYNGSSYYTKQETVGNLPTNTTYWGLVAQKGDAGAGSGDVVGPASAVDSNFAAFDTATGKLIKDSSKKASDFEPAKGADDNYVTDAEKTMLGTLAGAWTAWSPTTGGITIGSGTLTARSMLLGKTRFFMFRFVFAADSAITGAVTFTLPSSPKYYTLFLASALDSGTTFYDLKCSASGSTAVIRAKNSAGTYVTEDTALSSTIPFTWAVNDTIDISGVYEET